MPKASLMTEKARTQPPGPIRQGSRRLLASAQRRHSFHALQWHCELPLPVGLAQGDENEIEHEAEVMRLRRVGGRFYGRIDIAEHAVCLRSEQVAVVLPYDLRHEGLSVLHVGDLYRKSVEIEW